MNFKVRFYQTTNIKKKIKCVKICVPKIKLPCKRFLKNGLKEAKMCWRSIYE